MLVTRLHPPRAWDEPPGPSDDELDAISTPTGTIVELVPGARAWRIGERAGAALRCVISRRPADDTIWVRTSTLSKTEMWLRLCDVFADRDACRAEIRRRSDAARAA